MITPLDALHSRLRLQFCSFESLSSGRLSMRMLSSKGVVLLHGVQPAALASFFKASYCSTPSLSPSTSFLFHSHYFQRLDLTSNTHFPSFSPFYHSIVVSVSSATRPCPQLLKRPNQDPSSRHLRRRHTPRQSMRPPHAFVWFS
jgi:hypothetical protein